MLHPNIGRPDKRIFVNGVGDACGPSHSDGGQLSQLIIQHLQELTGRVRIAGFNLGHDMRDVGQETQHVDTALANAPERLNRFDLTRR
jgi:hypothetical protein